MSGSGLFRKFGKLLRLLQSSQYRRALRQGVAAAIEHEPALSRVRAATVVDIGANKGQFSLTARQSFPDARIIAFEPMPEAAAIWERVFQGQEAVTLHRCAVGESESTATLHVSARDDSSSLLPIGERQEAIFPGTGESGTMEIPVRRLSAAVTADDLAQPALLKLDVQGFELQALRGSEDLLHRFTWIYVECSYVELYEGQALADDVIQYLAAQGFLQTDRFNLHRADDGTEVQADLWFEREGSA